MQTFKITCPCHFGLEAVLKREIYDLGYDTDEVVDGRVSFVGDAEAIVRANIYLRSAERVLLEVGSFTATSFEDLYQGIKKLDWENYIPADGKFWVTKATSVKSALFSLTDIQRVVKKAMVDSLRISTGNREFPETGCDYPVRIFILKDRVTVTIDSTGTSLHKRGYRKLTAKAPLSETLAAAIIGLTFWKPGRTLIDPFCGSGTFCIEAAMMAANIAPGMNRTFTAMGWANLVDKNLWKEIKAEAKEEVNIDIPLTISGFDKDPEMIKIARANAKAAGVDKLIHFQQKDVSELSSKEKYGFIITNPPYGNRLEELKDMPALYSTIGNVYKKLDTWSLIMITSFEDAANCIGKKCDKNRKIYNGGEKTYVYQFLGPKPPKQDKD